jgi:hypothetical protein
MEVYAGFLAQTDKEIDRLADTIKDACQWDNRFLTGKSHHRSHLGDISRSADPKLLPPGAALLARDSVVFHQKWHRGEGRDGLLQGG